MQRWRINSADKRQADQRQIQSDGRQTDGERLMVDRPTDRQTRQTDRQPGRQADRQKNVRKSKRQIRFGGLSNSDVCLPAYLQLLKSAHGSGLESLGACSRRGNLHHIRAYLQAASQQASGLLFISMVALPAAHRKARSAAQKTAL